MKDLIQAAIEGYMDDTHMVEGDPEEMAIRVANAVYGHSREWTKVTDYDGTADYRKPETVLLWAKGIGHTTGTICRVAGEVTATAAGFHGFTWTDYQRLTTPETET